MGLLSFFTWCSNDLILCNDMGRLTVLLLAACVVYAVAIPTGLRNTCAHSCSSSMKFSYDEGMSYTYDYEVITGIMESPLSDESGSSSDYKVRAKATVGVVAPCEFVLSLSDVSSEGSADAEKFASEVSRKPLRFAFDDGKITHICAAEEEEEWVLNIKRGVLSNFQNTMRTLEIKEDGEEVDVTGKCITAYEPTMVSNDIQKVSRMKLSQNCNRTPVTSHTSLPRQIQNMPIIAADQTCDQTIEAGIMTHGVCHEVLSTKDFDGSRGTSAVIESKLVLNSQTSGVVSADFELKEKSLTFHEASLEDAESHFIKIESILTALETSSSPVMSEGTPALFSDLVKTLKHLDATQMTHMYKSYKGSKVWRFLVDAAPVVSTGASTVLMSDLIKEGEITQEEANIWYASLAFIQTPGADMFHPLAELVGEINPKDAIIGAGTLVKNFCTVHTTCVEVEGVQALISAVEEKLGSACRSTNDEERDMVLYALRALGIAERTTKFETIQNCFNDNTNPTEVRVAALELLKKLPCSNDKMSALSIYSDPSQDSEIRINAYLAMMSCPSTELIDTIKQKLVAETVNQVGTFVWTHLTNLQESASKNKQWIRELIGEEALAKKFNSSALKLSRNMETSLYMEEIGVGS